MTSSIQPPEAPVQVLPDEPIPVRLMNTVWADARGVHDSLRTPDDLTAWLAMTGLGSCLVDNTHLELFRSLRDALRRLAALVTDDSRPSATPQPPGLTQAVQVVNRAASAGTTGPRLRLHERRLGLDCAVPDAVSALAAVAGQAIELLTQDDAVLRACLAPRCVLYFVKNHPRREWCSTACGNRARAARHYRRHRADRPS